MRIPAACAICAFCIAVALTGCDRAAPTLPEQLPTGAPANVTPLPATTGTPVLIPAPSAAATPRPSASAVAANATPAGGIPVPAQSFKYTVQVGDTLASIAARFNTTVDVIRALNQLQGDQVTVGQVLTIPGTPPVAQNATPVPPPPTATATNAPPPKPTATRQPAPVTRRVTYTVRRGDNLFRIGLRFGVPWQTIARYNGISDPTTLQVGRVLVIPLGN